MKNCIFILLCLFFSVLAKAQHLPLFTQYGENIGIINPAAVSSNFLLYDDNFSFGASYRSQWVGLKNGPRTQTLHGSYLNPNTNSIGLMAGGYLINDQTGPTGFTGAYARIGGLISEDPYDSGLAFGLNIGAVQYRVKVSEIRLRDFNDILTDTDQTQLFPDVGLGVYYYKSLTRGFLDNSYFYAGLSVPQVIGLDLEFKDDTGEFSTKRIQHFYGLLGLLKRFSDDSFLEMSSWLKYAPNAPFNADFNIRYRMAVNFWIGTGLSTSGNFHTEAGFVFGENIGFERNLKLGYGFDYSFSDFGPFVGSTHEINLSFSFGE